MRALLLTFSLVLTGTSFAAPVVWTLNATFSEGLVTTGQFTYDSDTNQYSDVSISFNGNLPWESATSPGWPTPRLLLAGSGIWEPTSGLMFLEQFSLSFEQNLTNAGGEVGIESGYYYFGVQDLNQCFHVPYCPPGPGDSQTLISGTISAVPIPTAAWLLGSALIGLGFIRHRNEAS